MASGGKHRSERPTPGGLAVGAKLGKYEIVERLGVGGQSIVYKGLDPLLERHVAIKQVAPHLAADEKFVERFREVARRLAKLGCEQVVTIHELMEDPRGLFVVMEFVQGHSIETTLASQAGPVEPKAVLQIIWRIAAGLAAIHKAGIIHRDVKPGNIIVGEGLRVKITDFGVATQAGAPASMRLGTTKYMAPELFTGDQVTQRVDIYSLGMIAYEMLLGREKFNEVFRDVVRDPHSEALRWMKWHCSEAEALPLSELDETVPAAMSTIVTRMLAKSPADRYPDAEALGKDIRANFSARAQRPGRRGRRRRRASAAAAAAEGQAGAALADTADALTLAPASQAEPATAEIPRQPMSPAKKLAIVGVAVGLFLAAFLAWKMIEAADRNNLIRQAQAAFDEAREVYLQAARAQTAEGKKKLFAQAKEGFSAVIKQYGQTARHVCRKAEARGHLAQAYALVMAAKLENEDYAERRRLFEDADKSLDRVHTLIGQLERQKGPLYKWTQKMFQELEAFRRSRDRIRQFLKDMRDATKAMTAGDLNVADELLRSAMHNAGSDEEKAEVEALRQSIVVRREHETYSKHIRRAVALAKVDNIPEAAAAYDDAIAVLESIRPRLTEAHYNEMKQKAEAGKAFLLVDDQARKAKAQAAAMEKKKDPLGAAGAYRRVAAAVRKAKDKLQAEQYRQLTQKYDPEKLIAKADDLEHDYWLRKGYEDLQAGRIQPAVDNFNKARKFKDSAAVQTALGKVEKRKNYQAVLSKAEKLYSKSSYEAARDEFRSALKYPGADRKHIQSRVSNCDYYIFLAKAEAAKGERKWKEARRYYLQAKRAKRSASATVDALLDELTREREFVELMDAAERAIQTRDWSEAMAKLNQAKKVRPRSARLAAMLKDVQYQQQLEMGQTAFQNRDYKMALAYFKQARGFKPTPEIDELIAKAEELKKQEEESGE